MHEGIHITLKAEAVTHIFGMPITNTLLMSWLVMAVLITVGILVGRNLTKIPGKLQTFFETVFSFLLNYIEEVLESRTLALRFFPLLVTLFMFILLGNWMGLLPGVGSIYVYGDVETHVVDGVAHEKAPHIYLFHPIATDLNVTLALAVIAFLVIEFSGFFYLGVRTYLGKFFNFRSPIGFFVGIIELISEFVRLVSFSFRLFGNMFAGKTLILVAMFFAPYLVPVPLLIYEVFVGFVQAAIFTLLTLFFIKLAIATQEAH
jgi:F-type H+-transporting ATPase subunit a